MPANRTFDFPVSTLLRDSKRLHAALVDTTTGPAVARRLAKKNTLYKMCQSVQNAARFAYPATKAAKDEDTLVARNRFLLDEFPPRGGASNGDKPAPAPPAP